MRAAQAAVASTLGGVDGSDGDEGDPSTVWFNYTASRRGRARHFLLPVGLADRLAARRFGASGRRSVGSSPDRGRLGGSTSPHPAGERQADRGREQQVNETAERIRSHQPEGPEHQQHHDEGPEDHVGAFSGARQPGVGERGVKPACPASLGQPGEAGGDRTSSRKARAA